MLFAVAVGAPAAPERSILVYGDSLSAAYGIAQTRGWVALLEERLKREQPDYIVVNASISGETTAGGLARIGKALAQHRPRVVILELGANDGLRGTPVERLKSNLSHIVSQARARGISVLVCGMEALPIYGLDYSMQFHRAYRELAEQFEVPLVPFMLAGVIGREEMMQRDRIHPTAAGARMIADNIWPYLKPLAEAIAPARIAAPE